MTVSLKDVWSKLTPEEQDKLEKELRKILQEEIDREVISAIKKGIQQDESST
jgi:TRAP-type C4-dicarboxylate transport system substrate-binding protein